MRSMRTPEGGSSYRVRGHQEGAELFSLFTLYVNTPKGAVVTKQVPINTNLSPGSNANRCVTFKMTLQRSKDRPAAKVKAVAHTREAVTHHVDGHTLFKHVQALARESVDNVRMPQP